MAVSVFLAKSLGLYLSIVSIAMLINADKFKQLCIDIMKDPALLFVTGFLALIIGILLVVSHNVWTGDWRVIITLVAWLSLLKGVIRVGFPEFALKTSKNWMQNITAYYATVIVTLVIGIFLIYCGLIHS